MGAAIALCEEAGSGVGASQQERLIARCRAGDRQAQEALVRQCQERVYRLAYGLLGDRDEALDAVQEALVALLRSLRGFRGDASFDTWLYRVTTNICLMQRRREQARTRLLSDASSQVTDLTLSDADPESALMTHEVQLAVRQGLRQLPAEFRAVVVLRELEGLSYDEIARVLRIPLGTVQSRLSRGRRLLRQALLADERVSSLYPRGDKT